MVGIVDQEDSSSLMSSLGYISAEEVVELLTRNKSNLKYQIVDVRAGDVGDLMIHGAVNIPVAEFRNCVDELAKGYESYDLVIIHCMMSQTRGPMCASLLYDHISRDYPQSSVQVRVLQGGFERFYNEYCERGELFDTV